MERIGQKRIRGIKVKKLIFLMLIIYAIYAWNTGNTVIDKSSFDAAVNKLQNSQIVQMVKEKIVDFTKNNNLDFLQWNDKQDNEENRFSQVDNKEPIEQDSKKEAKTIQEPLQAGIDLNSPLDMETIITTVQDNFNTISFKDRLTLATLVLNNFDFSELNEWKDKLSKGMTAEQKDDFISMINEKFSSDEIEQLSGIVKKYANQFFENDANINAVVDAYISN